MAEAVEVTTTIMVADQNLWDIFVIAIEGDMTRQWANYLELRYDPADVTEFHALIEDMESNDRPDRIDRQTIVKGLRRALRDGYKFVLGQTIGISNDPDEWDLDAIGADCIVQYGLFGEVVYG